MNQAERLVRNLCEDARRRVQASKTASLDKQQFTTPLKKLPIPVRRALMEINMLTPRMKAARAVIESAGYAEPSCGQITQELSIEYTERKRQTSIIEREHDANLQDIATLQNEANVMLLGRNGKDAKPVLDKLQRDLKKRIG